MRKSVFSFLCANTGRENIFRIVLFGDIKQRRTYDSSNPAERVSIPGGSMEHCVNLLSDM